MCSTATHAGLMFVLLDPFSLAHKIIRDSWRERSSFSFPSGQDLAGVQMDTVNQRYETNRLGWMNGSNIHSSDGETEASGSSEPL